jgi:hypothetical protein
MADDIAAAPAPAPAHPIANPAEGFQKLLDQNKQDALAVASKLYDENFNLRQKNRDLTGKIPAEGSKILSTEEAAKFQAFLDLGVEPTEIKTSLAKIPELEKTTKELGEMETYREVAAIGGYKVPVLKKLMSEHPDAKLEVKTEKDKDQKETKVVYLRTGDKVLPFTEFAEQNFADFLPALKVEADPPQIKIGNSADPPPALGSAESPADQKAMAAQARSTHSHF